MSETDASSSGADRRRYPRAELDLLVQYRYSSLEEFMEKMASNLSTGGMFIVTETPRPEGATVYLRFTLDDGVPLIEGIGRVVRVNPPGDPDRAPGMGVEFESLDDESVSLIESIVEQRLVPAPEDESR